MHLFCDGVLFGIHELWPVTLSSWLVNMNYPPASEREKERHKQSSEGWREIDIKREEEVMAHFTQRTMDITGGLCA